MVRNSRDDDNPVAVVAKGFIAAVGNRRVSADGCCCCHRWTGSGINQSFHSGCILKMINVNVIKKAALCDHS